MNLNDGLRVFVCNIRLDMKMQTSTTRKYFTKFEDEMMKKLVEKYPRASFSKIAAKLQSQFGIKASRAQCYQRWKVMILPKLESKQEWTLRQDQYLLQLLRKHSIDFYLIMREIKKRTIKNIRERATIVLLKRFRIIEEAINQSNEQQIKQSQLRTLCHIVTSDLNSKLIQTSRQQLLFFDIKSQKLSAQAKISYYKSIYSMVLQIKKMEQYINQPQSRKIPSIKEYWFNNQQKRLFQLFCTHGKKFVLMSKTLRRQFNDQQKYQSQFLRAKTIGLLRDGLRKLKRISQIRNIYAEFNFQKMVARGPARKLLALESPQSRNVKQTIFGLNFTNQIKDQQITKIIHFLNEFSKTKAFKHKCPSQKSKVLESLSENQSELSQ